MLKTNSKKAKANIEKMVLGSINSEYLDECGYKPGVAGIYEAFQKEKVCEYELQRCGGNLRALFKDWLEGLPSAFSFETRYWDAAQIVGGILEETQEEIERYFDKDSKQPYELYKNMITDYIFSHK